MTTTQLSHRLGGPSSAPTLRVSGPAELLNALPYVIGFHPHDSLVLVGLEGTKVIVTARLDLTEVTGRQGSLDDTLTAMRNGGASLFVAAVYDDATPPSEELVEQVVLAASLADCEIADVLYVALGRWWSLGCDNEGCCDAEGRELSAVTSRLHAEA
ncbi:MAG TPA: DUF4192 domain-containing protein, partial [Jatrophihabitans sp.]